MITITPAGSLFQLSPEASVFLIFLYICRGRIRVSYDVGNNPVSTMFSYEILNDGKYHTVQLLSVMKVKNTLVDVWRDIAPY